MTPDNHEHWMQKALELAHQAQSLNEVPVGALVVREDEIIGSGFNCPISSHDPTAHAEITALRAAALSEQNYRLPRTTLYVTIEPCTMCVGAILHARIHTLVFGAREPRAGAVVSQQNLLEQDFYNHKLEVVEGILAADCAELMQQFFQSRR